MKKRLLSVLLAMTFCIGPGSAAFAAGEAEEGDNASPAAEGTASNEWFLSADGEILASGDYGGGITWTLYGNGTLTLSGEGSVEDSWDHQTSSIPDSTWGGYASLVTGVVIGSGVTGIWYQAFSGCDNLTAAVLCGDVEAVGYRNLLGSSDSGRKNGFFGCTGLEHVSVLEGATAIGEAEFRNCADLVSVEIAESVTSIGENAFRDCASLTDIQLPDSLETIGDAAFQGCGSLTGIRIPAGVTAIGTDGGSNVFQGCVNLTDITVDDGNPDYAAEDGILYSSDKTVLIAWPAASGDVVIPDSVTSFVDCAFQDCAEITGVTIPEGVTAISYLMLDGCANLEKVVIPDTVTTIGAGAFRNCASLAEVTIPASVTEICYMAFYGCGGLERVVFLGDAPEFQIGNFNAYTPSNDVFSGVSAAAYYPAGNGTWTEEIMRYGSNGNLTWAAYRDLSEIPGYGGTAGTGTSGGSGDGNAAAGTFYMAGDINGDGAVNISDVQTLLKYVNGQGVPVRDGPADVNGDGAVNISDVQTLLKYVNGQDVTIY